MRESKFVPSEIGRLMASEFDALRTPFETTELHDEAMRAKAHQILDMLTFMVNCELVKSHAGLNAYGIDFAAPFLDEKVIAHMAALPRKYSFADGRHRYVSRRILGHYLPESMLDPVKHGFSIPLCRWLRGALRPLTMRLLDAQRIEAEGILNPREVSRIVEAFYAGNDAYRYKLWSLLMFALWSEENLKTRL